MPRVSAILALSLLAGSALADNSVHRQIDQWIREGAGGPVSPPASDAEFLRRAYLDFAGRIPTVAEARAFLSDSKPGKRVRLIDRLLNAPSYAERMAEAFNIMLMERLGEHKAWDDYLQRSFAANKPWNQMAAEILSADAKVGAAFWMSKRLENYGQNPVDYPALTRDIGRLFLGKDLQCAQCHDHLFVDDYKQRDFQGLFAFVKNVALKRGDKPAVVERPTTMKIAFSSVFEGIEMKTGPRIPGFPEIAIPTFKKGEEYKIKPDRKKKTDGVLKFSTLEKLGEVVPNPKNEAFARNFVNRMWFLLMGHGLVEPLDMHHSKNPPSHPRVLDVLAREFVAHKYDIKWLLRELALTETYQRSSVLPDGVEKVDPRKYRSASPRRLSAEQLLRSMLIATGEAGSDLQKGVTTHRKLFLSAFANPPREPEEAFAPTLKAALFLLNNPTVLSWLEPKPGNLVGRLAKTKDDTQVARELYLAILTRLPEPEEIQHVRQYLSRRSDDRSRAIRNVAWALLASTEFCVNH